jgi:hypothetical protein
MLLSADTLVVARSGAALANGQSIDRLVNVLNGAGDVAIIIAAVGSVVGIVREVRRIRARRTTPIGADSPHVKVSG